MEVWYYAVALFLLGYVAGVVAQRIRAGRGRDAVLEQKKRRCDSCRYCYEISKETKSMMRPSYAGKLLCILGRGAKVPVGYESFEISVVDGCSCCDQWKERDPDG